MRINDTVPHRRIDVNKKIFLLFGFIFVGVAGLGFILPVLPGTPFLLLAAWCFARSSERWHQWLLNSALFGPVIRNWEENRCISLRTKTVAISSMLVVGGASIIFGVNEPMLKLLAAGLITVGAVTVLSINTCPGVSGVIVYILKQASDGKRVLFLRRSGGQFEGSWWPVAGTPEAGESPLETAKRELKEETGLTTESWQPFGIDIPNVDGVRVLKAFVVHVDEDDKIRLNYEHDDLRWLSEDEILEIVPSGSRQYIEHLVINFIKLGSSLESRL